MSRIIDGGSFKDPSGYVFHDGNDLFRSVNKCYRGNYDQLMQSGLYEALVATKLLVPHTEVEIVASNPENEYKVLLPQRIPFISYPYEWSFSMLKDAALTTLGVMERSLEFEMVLKDANAYNMQFLHGKPIFIDTLSFESYIEGRPWVAYGQFCRHFLAPLALMAYTDVRLSSLLAMNLDGIPLDLASGLLPRRTRIKLGLGLHIHAHARSIARADRADRADRAITAPVISRKFSRMAMKALIDSMKATIQALSWKQPQTAWGDYYANTNYTKAALDNKKKIVREFLARSKNKVVLDLGSNDGTFSRLAAETGCFTLSCDFDPVAVERNYLWIKKTSEQNMLPLIINILNPTPALGWMNEERKSFTERVPRNCTVLALALIHHLSITGNVPFDKIFTWIGSVGNRLIIEFIPKDDSQVLEMLRIRTGTFPDYKIDEFIRSIGQYYHNTENVKLEETKRTLFYNEK